MRFLSGLLTALVVAALAFGGVALGGKALFEADGPLEEPSVFNVERGAGLILIANRLEEEGVISSSLIFRVAAMAQGVEGRLQAGEYAFEPGVPMAQVLESLASGDVVPYQIKIIPGTTVAEAVALIEASDFLTGEITEIPPEGMVQPETHNFTRGADRQEVLDFFVAAQERTLEELWATRAEGLPFDTPEEALILASVVQAETTLAAEYPIVASVFVNRLEDNWRLEADATVIYGLIQMEGGFSGDLTDADLDSEENPWNTREHRGLPPTPISNPSRGALEGVLNPADTGYFFFVADGTGGHAFAATLPEHNANVARWLEIERNQ